MRRISLAAAFAGIAAFGATFDVVTNFNASNNPSRSGVFSYGSGTPAAFIAMPNGGSGCFGTSPTYCLDNGVGFPYTSAISWNGTGATIGSGTVTVPADAVRMDPQSSAGAIVRFTTPTTGMYDILGHFAGADTGQNRTAVKIFQNQTTLLFSNTISTYGQQDPFNLADISLTAGDTIDFVVISDSGCCYLSTGLGASITSTDLAQAPEPATIALVVLGLPLLALRRSKKQR